MCQEKTAVWSLWEIMKQYDLSTIVEIATRIGSIRTLILSGGPGRSSLIDDTDQVLPLLKVGEAECATLGLALSARAFKRLADAMAATPLRSLQFYDNRSPFRSAG